MPVPLYDKQHVSAPPREHKEFNLAETLGSQRRRGHREYVISTEERDLPELASLP